MSAGLGARHLLRRRRFGALFAARMVSVLGNAFAPIAVAFGVLGLPGADAGTLAIVVAAQAVPQLVLLLVGGVLADRFRRDVLLIVSETVAGLAFGGLAIAFLTGFAQLGWLVTCAAFAGAASALMFPALAGVVPDLVPREELQAANALLALASNVSRVAGIAAAGAVVAVFGPGVALAVDAATYLLAAVLLSIIRLSHRTRTRRQSVLADLALGWREFTGRTWLWVTVVAAAFINAGSRAGFGVLGPVLAERRFGGAAGWSVVLGAYAVGTITGVVVAGRIRPRRPLYVAAWCATLLAAPFVALGLGAPLAVVVAAALISGVAFDVFGVLWQTTVQREVPGEVLSRVSAYEYVGAYALGPLGVALAGPVELAVGAEVGLLGAAVVLVGAALVVCATPDVRRLRSGEREGEQA